ncbi:MAG: alanine--glyoxylate aminotransferase family protein, partial [Clostridia bacterium]|nr:alanine--glyoxylate aminotransferase family protein [Clostridia bacterium]
SQKALMTPPGLGLVSVSPAAWEANATARLPRFYWDFQRARASAEKGQTPYTPAVSLWFGLREGLRLIAEEGLVNCFARYRRMGAMLRAGVRAMGLQTLAEDAVASPVVTAVRVPAGVDGGRLLRDLRERHRIVAAGGQGPLQGKIFRVAHMGMTQPSDILRTLVAVADCLQAQGVDASADQAVAAAEAAGRGAA